MKPDFALDFRDNQIALLHRQDTGWAIIGRVGMDDPDLDAAMAYLRATALGLSPRGVASKLILPNEAILYTELPDLPYGQDRRAAAIERALEGRTPYAVADLVYDWTDAGSSAHVAVIARETLEEAEGFASQHRFNPVSFAALPDQGGYDGEVWFGATQLSQSLLARGEVVERDDVTLLAVDTVAAPASKLAASDFEMGAEQDLSPAAEDMVADDVAAKDAAAKPDPSPETAPEAQAEPAAQPQADGREVWQDFVDDTPAAAPPVAEAVPVAEPPPAAAPLVLAHQVASEAQDNRAPEPPASFEATFAQTPEPSAAPTPPEVEEAPMAVDVPLIDDLPPPESFGEKTPTRAEKLLAAFAARRAAALAKAEADTNARRVEPMLRAAKGDTAQASLPLDEAEPSRAPDTAGTRARKSSKAQVDSAPAPSAESETLTAAPATPTPKLGAPEVKLGRAPDMPAVSGLRPAIVKHVPAKPQPYRPQDLKAMPKPKVQPRFGMGLGWILTAVLLVALVAAGALSELLMTSYNALYGKDSDVAAVEPAPDAQPAQQALSAQIAAPNAAAPKLTAAAIAAAPAPVPQASVTPAPIASAQAPLASPFAQTLPPTSAADLTLPPPAIFAAAQAPATADSVPEAAGSAATALASANADLPAPLPRPAEGAAADMAAAIVQVVQGKPALTPIPRPDVVLAAATLARPAASSEAALAPLPAADPALAGAKPLPRPDSVLAAAAAAAPAPALGPPPAADPTLADARPAKRPDDILAAGRAARLAAASASIVAGAQDAVAEAALAPTPLADDPNLSPLAVAVSRFPAPRPAGLKSAFEQALAAAAALEPVPEASPPAEEVASNAAPADASVEDEVGLDGAAAERSVVAKQATQRNMLNLQDTNLIGIFGSQSNRYALIRQPGGSFKRLKVGDRFDGGRIAAITESEVRYEKGGDLLALRMPKI